MEIKQSELEEENRGRFYDSIMNRNTYNVLGYKFILIRRKYQNGTILNKFTNVSPFDNKRPAISEQLNDDFTTTQFVISLSGKCSMSIEDAKAHIEAYQNAIAAVEWLNNFKWSQTDIILIGE